MLAGAALGLLAPRSSQAGVLSALIRLFGFSANEIEETLPAAIFLRGYASELPTLEAGTRPPGAPRGDAPGDPLGVVEGHALVAPLNPLGILPPKDSGTGGGQIFVYTIRPGDTLSAVAESFGVTVNTILWANGIANPRLIKTGDQVLILPVSGVKHEVQKGDTLESIAKKYRASLSDILAFNGLASDEALAIGAVLIVPDGELPQALPITVGAAPPSALFNLPVYEGYYLRPIIGGRRSRGLHGFNGIDLAAPCGMPVLASADGSALIARSSGWNGGYGRYIVISHANGTQTLYSHLKDLLISPGEAVRQGESIGTIGSTGNSTGCHVHFEVRGARNPF